MNHNEFWKIIEKSKQGAESEDEQAEQLESILLELPSSEIQSFDYIFNELRYSAYRWDIWGVAYILCGGCSDDSFDYFRAWLISRGQEFFEDAMKDAESIADKVTEDDFPEAELLMYAAGKAYESKTGNYIPDHDLEHPKEPAGSEWEEDKLPTLFPRAASKEGICG